MQEQRNIFKGFNYLIRSTLLRVTSMKSGNNLNESKFAYTFFLVKIKSISTYRLKHSMDLKSGAKVERGRKL